MAKKTTRKRSFKGRVSRNAQKQSRRSQYGHLTLPKGIAVYREEPKTRVQLDILPYEVTDPNHPDRDDEYQVAIPGELWYKRPYWMHRDIGPTNDSVICRSTIKQKCPICEYRAQLLKDGTDWNDDTVKALKAKMRNLYVVIPKGAKNYEEKPHIWDISQFLFQDKLNEEIGENEEYETFPDLEEGFTLRIRFSEEQLGSNKFAETSRIDFVERQKPYKESILEEIPSLDEVLEVPSYKAVEAMFFGGLDQEEVIDDEDDDEDDEGIDQEEEEKPSRSRRSAPAKEVIDDDEDDEDDEDDVETEEQEDDDKEDIEEEKTKPAPIRRRGKKESETKPKSKNKCPHGHKFGVDCEEYEDCDKCDVWEDCMDASK